MTKDNVYKFVQDWISNLPCELKGYILPYKEGFKVELIRKRWNPKAAKTDSGVISVFDWDLVLNADGSYLKHQLHAMYTTLVNYNC